MIRFNLFGTVDCSDSVRESSETLNTETRPDQRVGCDPFEFFTSPATEFQQQIVQTTSFKGPSVGKVT